MSRVAADLVSRSLLCFGIAAAVGGLVQTLPLEPFNDVSELTFDHDPRCGATATFGVIDDMGSLVPSDIVPLVPGQQFGWELALEDEGLHTWREVLITPQAPREWVGADLQILDEGRVGITERTEVAVDGVLAHAWTITDGDPAGHHVLELWLDGRLVKRASFMILAPR